MLKMREAASFCSSINSATERLDWGTILSPTNGAGATWSSSASARATGSAITTAARATMERRKEIFMLMECGGEQ